ncbi:MAG TPA: ROK family protein [Terriglobales bacterium]|nr:ROK family protein [Terriglobales bacterium]
MPARKTPIAAGFDLGGTELKYGAIDAGGRLVLKGKTPSPGSMPELLSAIKGIWARMKVESPGPVRSCGFGFAGFYSLKDRRVLDSPNYPSLDGFDLFPALRKVIDVPFRVDNDANMAAYGESLYGAGRGAQSLVLLTVGTGIGSGIILDGRLWQGKCGFAGELGHITVNPEGSRCSCGNIGCLETEASAPKIVRNYRELAGRPGPLTSRDVYLLARKGDKAARESFARCAYYLGIGLGIVINFLNPEKILIGGGVVSAGSLLLKPAIAEARRRSHRVSFACCRIEKASLGNDAGLIGAAAWARAGRG